MITRITFLLGFSRLFLRESRDDGDNQKSKLLFGFVLSYPPSLDFLFFLFVHSLFSARNLHNFFYVDSLLHWSSFVGDVKVRVE